MSLHCFLLFQCFRLEIVCFTVLLSYSFIVLLYILLGTFRKDFKKGIESKKDMQKECGISWLLKRNHFEVFKRCDFSLSIDDVWSERI